eukprot:Pgem_evm1s2385
MQKPETRLAKTKINRFDLMITLSRNQTATGNLYIDDGVSLKPKDSLTITFTYKNNVLMAMPKQTGDKINNVAKYYGK